VTAVVATVCLGAGAWSVVATIRSRRPEIRRIVLHMTPVIALTPLLDVAAGALLGRSQDELVRAAGVLILIPPFVSQSGALGGILASRLSSKLQLGVIRARAWPDPAARLDGAVVAALATATFLIVGVGATVLAELTTRDHPGAATMIGGTMLAGLFVLPVVLVLGYAVAVATARFGFDPDDHSVPVITSAMDLVGVAAVLVAMQALGVLAG
jgi:mgtE-like transporter